MQSNHKKSTITLINLSQQKLIFAQQKFPFRQIVLREGLKYLAFYLKPNKYLITDWIGLVARIEAKIHTWYNCWISRARRLVLIKLVLEAIPVYWMALAWIPKDIMRRIQHVCCRFLWRGNKEGKTFAWIKWDQITRPRKWDGWGMKNLILFSKALVAKLGWKLLKTDNLWKDVVFKKYIYPLSILDWFRNLIRTRKNNSTFWRAFLNSISVIKQGLTWHIRSGESVRIGKDAWSGCINSHTLPQGVT